MSIDVDDLEAAGLGDRFDAIEDAVGDHLEGSNANVAVISEPFAGRDVLLDYAEEFLGAATRRITFDSVVTGVEDLPDLDTHEVVLIDNCQYLYTRQVGGFDVFDRFLERVAASDALFVTSWNRYAWDYLAAVRDVDQYFPTQVPIPALDANQVTDLLTSNYGPDLPDFVETGEAGRVKTIGFDAYPVPLWGEWTLDVPVPELNLEYVTFRFLSDVEEDAQAVVFRKIASLSKGDPGVATALWERSVRDGEIAPAYVEEVDQSLDLDDDAAFVLEIVVSKERIDREQLDRITETEPIADPLQTLLRHDLVEVDEVTVGTDGEEVPLSEMDEDDVVDAAENGIDDEPETRDVVSIVPYRLHASVRHLKGRQLIW